MRWFKPAHARGVRLAGTMAAVTTALMLHAPVANAQNCYDLGRDRDRLNTGVLRLVADYPLEHAMAAGCAGSTTGATPEEKSGAFVVCAGLGCLFLGVDRCLDVTVRWFDLVQQKDRIEQFMLRQNCRP